VLGEDLSDGARLRPHDQRMSGDMTALELHSVEQVAVRDAGGYEVAVVAGDEVVGVEDLIDVEAGRGGGFAFGVVLGPQTTLDDSAEGLDGAGGDDALGGVAAALGHVGSRGGAAGGDGSGDITVGDELDAGPGGADLIDHLLM